MKKRVWIKIQKQWAEIDDLKFNQKPASDFMCPNCMRALYFRWTELAPLNEGRSFFALAWVPDGRLFAVGGGNDTDGPLATVEMLECPRSTEEIVNSKWQYVSPMNQGRYAHAVAYFKSKIIAAGGDERESVECFSLPTSELPQGQWITIRPMSHPNTLFGIFPFGKDLLFVGKHVVVCYLVVDELT